MIDDLHTLRSFVAVVDCGSVVAAARHRGYSTAAVSRQLGRLQRRLGVRLFEPAGRGIRATDEGRRLADEARQLITQVRIFEDAASAIAREATATLPAPKALSASDGSLLVTARTPSQ
ncbi:LysR family transcriptional regulator [Microbacterium gallinarum]|jgi:DNA-binding transcriptional LysR family regulator|uniref:LysR family transcriptional regulator n=1 Tax=Microbacterium gallinarum TaxID=2762209 RepID=A0ABR8X1Y5_9MICO|nr:LysR family transcriptional regulator [Microbacterium gallinarum]MBD8023298.1 LysR family transcriptional regulator [Microbacterium gallinarum]